MMLKKGETIAIHRLKCAVLLYQIDLLRLTYPDAQCMEYLTTFTREMAPNVGKYSIHGASGLSGWGFILLEFLEHAVGFNQPQPIC